MRIRDAWSGFWLAYHFKRAERLTDRADRHRRRYYVHGRLREYRRPRERRSVAR